MISRRSLLVTGATAAAFAGGLFAADSAHRLDDLARAVGVQPRPTPNPGDLRLLAGAVRDQDVLLATVEATSARHPALKLDHFIAIGRSHVEAVGGSVQIPGARPVPGDRAAAAKALAKAYSSASKRRADDGIRAVSPDLARVLSSMSAGLAQCSQAVDGL